MFLSFSWNNFYTWNSKRKEKIEMETKRDASGIEKLQK